MQHLFDVENVFHIDGRGCVLVPGIPSRFRSAVQEGQRLLIITPRGEHIRTHIVAFERFDQGRLRTYAPFSLPSTVKKLQLPIGSKVYLVAATHLDSDQSVDAASH